MRLTMNVTSSPGLLLGSLDAGLPAVLSCLSLAWPGLHRDFQDSLGICREALTSYT